jgi:hypothetical protein
MSCNHANPAGYRFCSHCGEALNPVRCRCGFVAAAGEAFCGRCGANLLALATGSEGSTAVDHRYDLLYLGQQATQEKQFLESTEKVRVTQDDIRKLLSTRRRKFR